MPKTIYSPRKQINKWHFWKISFGDVLPEPVRDQCFSNDDQSVTMWTPDPKHAIEATKEKFYGYGAKKFWDEQYDKNQITIKPGVNPLTDSPPTIDTPEMNVSELKDKPEPEEEPEPVKKEPSFRQDQFTFDSKIEKAIDKVLEQEDEELGYPDSFKDQKDEEKLVTAVQEAGGTLVPFDEWSKDDKVYDFLHKKKEISVEKDAFFVKVNRDQMAFTGYADIGDLRFAVYLSWIPLFRMGYFEDEFDDATPGQLYAMASDDYEESKEYARAVVNLKRAGFQVGGFEGF